MLEKARFWCALGRPPAFLCHYPHSVLFVIRTFSTVCAIAVLLVWNGARAQFPRDGAFTFVAIADLFALLFILLSYWFALQKFFYAKLDAALNFCSIVFVVMGVASACAIRHDPQNNDLFYIIMLHIYLCLAQFFSVGWALVCTQNAVSKLFISNWGRAVQPNELELLEDDF